MCVGRGTFLFRMNLDRRVLLKNGILFLINKDIRLSSSSSSNGNPLASPIVSSDCKIVTVTWGSNAGGNQFAETSLKFFVFIFRSNFVYVCMQLSTDWYVFIRICIWGHLR